jgi:DNA mismatch repair protein MSH2
MDEDTRLLPYFESLHRDELHIFARTGGAIGSIVLGPWARRIAVDYLKSASTIKPFGTHGTPSVFVNDSALKDIIRDALLVHGVAVSQHERRQEGGGWVRVRRGSPGNLGDFEGLLFEFATGSPDVSTASLLAVHIVPADANGTAFKVGCAVVNATLRMISIAQFTDDASMHSVDSIVSQYGVKEILVADTLEGAAPTVHQALKRIVDRASGVQLRSVAHSTFALAVTRDSTKSASEMLADKLEPLIRKSSASASIFELHYYPDACAAVACLIAESGTLSLAEPTNRGAFSIRKLDLKSILRLDSAAIVALDLMDTKGAGGGGSRGAAGEGGTGSAAATSVLGWLNRCSTGMGSRLMQQYLLQPLRSIVQISTRQSIVEALLHSTITRERLKNDVLRHLTDLDRLNRRLQRGTATLKEIHGLNSFMAVVPNVVGILRAYDGPNAKVIIDEFVVPFTSISQHFELLKTLVESTIVIDRNTPKINPEFDDELFVLHNQLEELHAAAGKETKRVMSLCDWTEKVLKCEAATNGGLLFRVSRKEDKPIRDAPTKFRIYSTSKEGVKFATKELDAISEDMKLASSAYEQRQRSLHLKLVETVATYVPLLDDAKELLAQLDVFCAWAVVASEARTPMTKPVLVLADDDNNNDGAKAPTDNADVLELRGLRHPLVETRQGTFVSNDVILGEGPSQSEAEGGSLWIVTGPNMGGKSTLMRSVGIAVVLAHAGCYVPAQHAVITVRDAVLCRVGAVDFMTQGLSTFMVEMMESSTILSAATRRSLVIVDELGRGTSTFDGFGLAWAIAEELAVHVRCQSLFASHFHELSELAAKHPRLVKNVHVTAEAVAPTAASGTPGLRFLYKLAAGPSHRSFGVHVARLAGMPADVVRMAQRKAEELEVSRSASSPVQTGVSPGDAFGLSSVLSDTDRQQLMGVVKAMVRDNNPQPSPQQSAVIADVLRVRA